MRQTFIAQFTYSELQDGSADRITCNVKYSVSSWNQCVYKKAFDALYEKDEIPPHRTKTIWYPELISIVLYNEKNQIDPKDKAELIVALLNVTYAYPDGNEMKELAQAELKELLETPIKI